ncbi:hypothetical protein EDC39_11222 [Geothermobacter ehrlichii]|uniref:Uncharacterized protein n=1 Tax=Geothermobacter ehrlichii TaxID=213224 RepID=A0A5D3WJH0_9BACT|nr:hypothetical protein EDC39_11222 [Geothermobacter ehrlichii]
MTQKIKAVRGGNQPGGFCFFTELQNRTDIGIRCYG